MPRLTHILFFSLLLISTAVVAQPDRWQQKIKYTMNVNMDVTTNRFTGTQKIDYFNQYSAMVAELSQYALGLIFESNSNNRILIGFISGERINVIVAKMKR